ncbi:hypothetical protein PFISCL1PPCAC_20524, partial [Pristionchus fissidentatus]
QMAAAERDFEPDCPENEDEATGEPQAKKTKVDQESEQPNQETEQPAADSTERRDTKWIDGKWVFRCAGTDSFMSFDDAKGWTAVPEDEQEFIDQLWQEAEAAEKQASAANGEADVDIAQYNMNYGVQYDYDSMKKEGGEGEQPKKTKEEILKEKAQKKIPRPAGWVDMEEKVHAVYVSGMPLDIKDEEFEAMISKCGVIQSDARTNKPKLKLYRDEDGNPKGDGRACYVRKESVDLALSLLDDSIFRGKKIRVEVAKFELKGEFDPKKKRKKLTNAQKKRFMEQQNKHFEWRPDKPRNYRPVSDCTVVIKGLFTIDEMNADASVLFKLKNELSESCAKFGNVKKVVVYDNNPEGVATVSFDSTEGSDQAVKMLNGRTVKEKTLEATLWDGKTKYKVEETEEQAQKRIEEWNKFVESGGRKEGEEEEKKEEEK